MWAHLTPLLQPVYPGSFDYGRYLWSRSIGGQGYLSNSIERLPEKTKSGWQGLVHDVRDSIERTRQAVARYILHRVDGEAGGFAVALAVGKRDFLADNVETSLRRSGLAHILAISGLHMALVAMSVFWGVRGILPCCRNYPCIIPSSNGRLGWRCSARLPIWFSPAHRLPPSAPSA